MKSEWHGSDASRLVGWLGIVWIYSGLVWLGAVLLLAREGAFEYAAVAALRLVLTIVLGVGLCATERWAWAPAVCLAGLYAVVGGAVGLLALGTVLTLPGSTLSWQPVFWGLNAGQSTRFAMGALGLAAVAGGALWLLWDAQAHLDVPYRRPFTILVRSGLGPALPVIAADLYLLYAWWLGAVQL